MNITGERDVATLLRSLDPVLDPRCWTFCTLAAAALEAPLVEAARVLVRETEGVTVVLTVEDARALGLGGAGEWALITLRVHSSLDAVGLMATVSTALSAEGISVNPVAGYYHDHLFVPWVDRDRAVMMLRAIASEVRPSGP